MMPNKVVNLPDVISFLTMSIYSIADILQAAKQTNGELGRVSLKMQRYEDVGSRLYSFSGLCS